MPPSTPRHYRPSPQPAIPAPAPLSDASQSVMALALSHSFPGQGRLLHHVRKGRWQQALAVCEQARAQGWQRLRQGASMPMAEQLLDYLASLERRIRLALSQAAPAA